MDQDKLVDDLAYARAIAEEGRSAPLIGGAYLVLFGVLLSCCYALQWAFLASVIGAQRYIGVIWLAFGVLATIGVALIGRRVRRLPGASAIANRVDRAVWHAATAAILTVVAGSIWRTVANSDFDAPNAIVATGFGLYGVALYVTATVGHQLWLRVFAAMAFLLSGLMWAFLDQSWLYLLAAGGSVAVLIIPGIVMLLRQPAATA